MSAILNRPDKRYRELIASAVPRVIHSEEDNARFILALETLHDRGRLTREEEQLSELLTLLIEDFENRQYRLKPASPIEVLSELMDANGLKQADLVDVFGTKSVVSEVLSGKRDFSKAHIQKLSERFHVSPEVFFSVL